MRPMTKARLIIEDSGVLADGARWTIRVWLVPSPVPPSTHCYKYSLYYGYPGERVVGYDNERGKGDHKHLEGEELPYVPVKGAIRHGPRPPRLPPIKGILTNFRRTGEDSGAKGRK